jgi:hypothetical protein
MALRTVAATRYVAPLREGGSLPGLVEGDDDGLYVCKFRGAGQGPLVLAAEVIAAELARALGLRVPELTVCTVDPALARAEPDPEIQELIEASAGENLGVDFLPGALPFTAAADIDPDWAADVVWFDALITNVDRTPRNPNLLCWHGNVWLIDHGAAFYRRHAGEGFMADAARPFPNVADHVLLSQAGPILEAHDRLASKVTRKVIEEAVAMVPADWLAAHRAQDHVEFLDARLRSGFAMEAEEARHGMPAGAEETHRGA